jgi:pyruvate formate lyase activating enzyme
MHMDTAIHRQFTGVRNARILKNLEALLGETKAMVWMRIPVVPGLNNSEEEIAEIGAYLRSLPRRIEKVSLLAFHQYGAGIYPALGKPYRWADQIADREEKIEIFKRQLEAFSFNVEIGR